MGGGANRTIVAMLVAAALAAAFWLLALGPKRDEAARLGKAVAGLRASLATDRQAVAQALAARRGFPDDYRELVVLGKAVPDDDDTASLLVQLNHIAERAGVRFQEIQLAGSGGSSASPPSPAAATEAAAALLPLGATIGPAGLGVMPYTLKLSGDFAGIADFIGGLDGLVETHRSGVSVDGRLITVDGFSLTPAQGGTFPELEATFSVTTYLTPPGEGVTGGATPVAPAPGEAVPAAAKTGGTP